MTLLNFTGSALIAFGPILSIFFFYVYRIPQLVLIMVASAFFYLLSLISTSIVWSVLIPIRSWLWFYAIVGFISVEIFRATFYFMFLKTERGFAKVWSTFVPSAFGYVPPAIASGLGFALCHALMRYGTILSQAWGPGTFYSSSCSVGSRHLNFFAVSALSTFCFVLIHIGLMVLAFEGFQRRSIWRLASLYILHLAANLLTLINPSSKNGSACVPMLLMLFACAGIAMALLVFQIALHIRSGGGGSSSSSTKGSSHHRHLYRRQHQQGRVYQDDDGNNNDSEEAD